MSYDIGPRIGLEGEKEFKRALSEIDQSFKVLGSEMKLVSSEFDKNDKSVSALTARNTALNKEIDAQKQKIETLRAALQNAAETFGESDRRTQNWQIQLNNAQAALNDMEREVADNEKAMSSMGDEMDEASGFTSKFAEGLKSGLVAAAKASAAAIAAVGAAAVKLGKEVVTAYAEYEQLVGGVETLFKDSSDQVLDYANNAYKTAGMSANEYMETVTSFSASLLQSLDGDTQAAADKADQAITDMSDNANKMGTDISSIQNAYQGFAKQNYTMLDNLKLGYGGTKEEMQRLLDDAEKLSGVEYDISSYADVVDAIHVIQTEMGIAGTTAKEAEATISGSLGMLKSSFANLLAGLGNSGADIQKLCGDVVTSLSSVISNVAPIIGNLAQSLPTMLTGMMEAIAPLLPTFMEMGVGLFESLLSGIVSVLPSLIETGTGLITSLASGIIEALPDLVAVVPTIIEGLVTAFSGSFSTLLETGGQLIDMILSGVMNGLPELAEAAVSIMGNLGQYLRENLPLLLESGLEALVQLTGSIRENAGLLVDGAISLAESLAQGLADSIPTIIENVPTIVSNIANTINDNAPKVFAAAVHIIGTLVKGLIDSIPTIVKNIPKIISAIWDTITAVNWINLGGNIIKGLSGGISGMVSAAKGAINTIKDALKEGVKNLPHAFMDIGKNIINGLIDGIKSMGKALLKNIGGVITSAVNEAKELLGINSPSKVFANEVGRWIPPGIGEGIDRAMPALTKDMQRQMRSMTDGLGVSFPVSVTGNAPGAAGSAVAAGAGFTVHIEHLEVRDETDVESIAQRLFQMEQMSLRGRGVNYA